MRLTLRPRLTAQLRLAVILPSVLAFLVVAALALATARDLSQASAVAGLEARTESVRGALTTWSSGLRAQVALAAAQPATAAAFLDPAGADASDERLAAAEAAFPGSDLLLVRPTGEVVAARGSGLGAPRTVGELPEGIAQAFRDALTLAPGAAILADFGPSQDGSAPAATLAAPVAGSSGRVGGVLLVRLPASALEGALADALGTPGGSVYVVGPDGFARGGLAGTSGLSSFDAPPPLPQVETAVLGDAASFDGVPGLAGGEVLALVRPLGLEGLDWTLVAERDRGAAMAPVGALALRLLAGAAVAVAIAAAVGWRASRRMAAPLGQLAQAARAVAERRADPGVPAAAGTDELADLARALATLRDDLARADEVAAEREVARRGQDLMVAELGAALSRLAQGDLTTPVEAPFAEEHDRLRQDVNATMSELSEILSTVVDRARQISQKASEISSASDDLSRRTENQAATLEETAAALDELTASVKSSAQGAAEVDGIVAKAREEAERSGEVVRHAVTAMAEIERSSDEIGQIIGVIDDIAFQTNLLALNAGVEAARAGEAGRGFAVVASEVRTLAQRSSDAARQIKELIGGSATQVRRGVGLVGKAGSALTSITDRVAHIAELVSDIASGAREQAAGLGEINNGVNQLDQVTQQNAAMVEEATSASHVLTQDARQLAELVARFRLPESAAPKVTAAPPPAPRIRAVAPRLEATTGRPVAEDDWEEF